MLRSKVRRPNLIEIGCNTEDIVSRSKRKTFPIFHPQHVIDLASFSFLLPLKNVKILAALRFRDVKLTEADFL